MSDRFMKHIRYFFLVLFLFCTSVQQGVAQEVSDYSKLTPDDYTNFSLPPLDLLFENAKAAPSYELAQVKEQIERKLLSKEKRAFLGFFSLRGSYQYGMFGNESTYTDVNTPIINNYSTAAQNSYSIGAGINIPLDGLFDLGARVKRQKLNIKSAELEKEIKYEEIKKEIIQLYSMASSQLNVLILRAEALTLANMQYDIIEKKFTNNTIESGELSVEKQRQSQAQEAFENSKFELTKSLMILEIITRTQILKK